jgi:small conductance mechanosensitive channel
MINFITSEQFFLPIIYICLGIIIFNVISRILLKITKVSINSNKHIDKKKKTITYLIRNIIKYLIAFIIVIAILNVYGVNTTSLITGLGVVGVVVGLAFEDIVKDLIAGITIIFDNHYEVGDYISVNDFMGEVISVGLKTTKIKAYTGEVKIISNSAFNEVINYSMVDYKLVIKIKLSYNQNIEEFEQAIEEVKEDILNIEGVKNLSLLGIDSYDDSSISYAIEITCKAMSQYATKRKCLKIIKAILDEKHIVIPYNIVDVNINKG